MRSIEVVCPTQQGKNIWASLKEVYFDKPYVAISYIWRWTPTIIDTGTKDSKEYAITNSVYTHIIPRVLDVFEKHGSLLVTHLHKQKAIFVNRDTFLPKSGRGEVIYIACSVIDKSLLEEVYKEYKGTTLYERVYETTPCGPNNVYFLGE